MTSWCKHILKGTSRQQCLCAAHSVAHLHSRDHQWIIACLSWGGWSWALDCTSHICLPGKQVVKSGHRQLLLATAMWSHIPGQVQPQQAVARTVSRISEEADPRVLRKAHQPGRRGSGTPGSPCLRALSTKLEFFLGPGSWELGGSAGQREGAVQIQSPSWGPLRVRRPSRTKPAPKILINELHNPVHP